MDPDDFARLMPELGPVLAAGEVSFAQEYLEAREYGLALETIVDDQ